MATSKVIYLGDLRTEATHIKSGQVIITDAPPDNHGKGEAFSPTDLVATAMGSCMFTIMGILSKRNGLMIDGTSVEITKIMADNPRRISEIHAAVKVPAGTLTDGDRKLLENGARTCPVIMSLSPEINKVISFEYV